MVSSIAGSLSSPWPEYSTHVRPAMFWPFLSARPDLHQARRFERVSSLEYWNCHESVPPAYVHIYTPPRRSSRVQPKPLEDSHLPRSSALANCVPVASDCDHSSLPPFNSANTSSEKRHHPGRGTAGSADTHAECHNRPASTSYIGA